MARLSETFSRVHDVMDVEKNLVLGKNIHNRNGPFIGQTDACVLRMSSQY